MPDGDEVFDGVAQAVVKVVLPEDSRHARVRQDVGIPRLLLPAREWPVLLRAACGNATLQY